jgi:hypothetical protein
VSLADNQKGAAISFNGASDNPFDYPPQVLPLPDPDKMDTTNDGYGWNLGTLFKGWELYNDTRATNVPTPQATVAAQKPAPNYLLYGGIAIAAILLLRR